MFHSPFSHTYLQAAFAKTYLLLVKTLVSLNKLQLQNINYNYKIQSLKVNSWTEKATIFSPAHPSRPLRSQEMQHRTAACAQTMPKKGQGEEGRGVNTQS